MSEATKDIMAMPDSELETLNAPAVDESPGISEIPEAMIFGTGKTAENTDTGTASGQSNTTETPKTPGQPPKINTKPLAAGSFVSGEFATNLMDSLVPALIAYAAGFVGYQLETKGLKLSEKDKSLIAPVFQQYLDSVNFNFNNPLYNLLFVVGTVYGAKIIENPSVFKKKQPATKKTATSETVDQLENIKEKLEKEQALKQKKQAEINMLRKLEKPVAVKWLQTNKKLSKKDAEAWLLKNL